MLTTAPVLAHYDDLDVVVQTDASQDGQGAMKLQYGGDGAVDILHQSGFGRCRGEAELQRARVSCLGLGVKKVETVCVLEKAQNTDEQLYF